MTEPSQEHDRQVLEAALSVAVRAADTRPGLSASVPLGPGAGAVLYGDDGATAWVVPREGATYIELVDGAGVAGWFGDVDTGGLLDHLDRHGVLQAAVAAYATGSP